MRGILRASMCRLDRVMNKKLRMRVAHDVREWYAHACLCACVRMHVTGANA